MSLILNRDHEMTLIYFSPFSRFALIVVLQEQSGSSPWRWRSPVACHRSSRRCWRTLRARTARAAAAVLQPRRQSAPAARAAPRRTPFLPSHRSPRTQRGQQPHRLLRNPRRRLKVPPKTLTFLCTKKDQLGEAQSQLTPPPLLGYLKILVLFSSTTPEKENGRPQRISARCINDVVSLGLWQEGGVALTHRQRSYSSGLPCKSCMITMEVWYVVSSRAHRVIDIVHTIVLRFYDGLCGAFFSLS